MKKGFFLCENDERNRQAAQGMTNGIRLTAAKNYSHAFIMSQATMSLFPLPLCVCCRMTNLWLKM
jgi:hypothetical protein